MAKDTTFFTISSNADAGVDGVTSTSTAATGTITCVAGVSLVDGETFTINDGVNAAVVFEFDSNGIVTPGRVGVTFTGAYTAGQVRDAVIAAINGVGATLAITASIRVSSASTR